MKTKLSRRATLAGLAAIAPAATAAAGFASAKPAQVIHMDHLGTLPAAIGADAELIALGKQLDVLAAWAYWLEPLRTINRYPGSWDRRDRSADDVEYDQVIDRIKELELQVMALRARTVEGLAVQARAAAYAAPELFWEDSGGCDLTEHGEKAVRGLVKAVLAAAGQGIPAAALDDMVDLEEGQPPTDFEALEKARLLGKDLVRQS